MFQPHQLLVFSAWLRRQHPRRAAASHHWAAGAQSLLHSERSRSDSHLTDRSQRCNHCSRCPASRLLTLNVAASLWPKCAFISPKDAEISFATAPRHCSRGTEWIWLSITASRCSLCRKQYQRGRGRLVARLSNGQTLQSVLPVMKSPLVWVVGDCASRCNDAVFCSLRPRLLSGVFVLWFWASCLRRSPGNLSYIFVPKALMLVLLLRQQNLKVIFLKPTACKAIKTFAPNQVLKVIWGVWNWFYDVQ